MPIERIIAGVVVLNFNVLWVLLYILVIRRGHLDKTFGIPVISLCANFAWDIFNSVNRGVTVLSPTPQPIINGVYAIIDLIIIYQVLRYWRRDFSTVSRGQFYFFFGFALISSFALMQALILEANDLPMWRSAFIDTFLNSALFILMFYRRPGLEGQSLYIGLCKLFGTAPFMLLLYFAPQLGIAEYIGLPPSILLPLLWIGIFILDVAYVGLVYQRARQIGLNPWRHF